MNSWVKLAAKQPIPENTVGILDLAKGQVFSLYASDKVAQRFELVNIDPAANIVTARAINPDKSFGNTMQINLQAHKDARFVVHKDPLFASQTNICEHQVFDRIRVKGSNMEGVIINRNEARFPSRGFVVLWSQPVKGQFVTEVFPHEVEATGQKVDPNSKIETTAGDKTFGQFVQELNSLRSELQKTAKSQTRELADRDFQRAAAERKEQIAHIAASQEQAIMMFATKVFSSYAEEMKRMSTACVNLVSSGDKNYEVDGIPSLLWNYADTIRARVASVCPDINMQVPVSQEVMKVIADTALKSFFLTRKGYIRKIASGGFSVHAEDNRVLGKASDKRKAVALIRGIEIRARQGIEES